MAKTKISQYDATAANNTDIDSINIAEGMAPSNVNNAIRELMAHLKDMDAGTQALTSPQLTSADINGGTIDGVTIGGASAGAITGTTITANTSLVGTLGTAAQANVTSLGTLTGLTVSGTTSLAGASTSADITFGDNDKAIFGAGSDLQIYHDGSESIIKDAGTGNLKILATDLRITNADSSKSYITGVDGSYVNLYYNGSQKLVTTNTGVDITGTLTSDGLTVDGSEGDISFGTGSNITIDTGANAANPRLYFDQDNLTGGLYFIEADRGNQAMEFATSSTNRMGIASNGDISFYEDTGTTPKFFWDASAESLGIGTSSPSSWSSAQNQLVVGDGSGDNGITIYSEGNGQGNLRFSDGTTGSQQYRGRVEYDHASDKLYLGAGGTTPFAIDSSGNVGIGTSSPVAGTKLTLNDAAFGGMQFQSGGSDCGYIGVSTNTLYVGAGSTLAFHTGNPQATDGSERMRISSDGSVGIGTSSPAAPLHVVGNDGVQFNRSGQTNGFLIRPNASTDGIRFTQGGTGDRMTLDASGNVGIGTSSPSSFWSGGNQLVVGSGTGSQGLTIYSGATSDAGIYFSDGTSGNALYQGQIFYRHSEDAMVFNTAATERIRLDSSGNLLVGTTAPVSSSQSNGSLIVRPTLTGSAQTLMQMLNNLNTTATGGKSYIDFYNGSGIEIGSITGNQSGLSYNTSSDHRLKENVVELTGATTRLKQLEPKRFNFIADTNDTVVDGFIAHEVQSIVPEAVTGTHNEVDDDGNPVYQGIDQSKLVPLLVATIQELEARITALENA